MKISAGFATLAVVASISVPMPVAAEEWARFSWSGRDGSGDILYRRDVPFTDPVNGGVTLRDSIYAFHVVGWYQLTEGHWFTGNGGSVVTHTTQTPCEDGFGELCTNRFLTFKLGALNNGDPKPWQVNITLPSDGYFDAEGRLPFFPVTSDAGWGAFGGYISNPVNDEAYGTLNMFSRVFHERVAAPVPEPGLPLLAGLGALGVLLGTSRRRRA